MTDEGETKLNDAGADAPVEIVAMVTDAGTKGVSRRPPPRLCCCSEGPI